MGKATVPIQTVALNTATVSSTWRATKDYTVNFRGCLTFKSAFLKPVTNVPPDKVPESHIQPRMHSHLSISRFIEIFEKIINTILISYLEQKNV